VVRWIGIGLVVLVAGTAAIALSGGSTAAACGAGVERGVLPEWARTGFSEKEPRIAHVIGRNGGLAVENGPGPSGVDLPAGCWRVKARWPGGQDELDLTYVAR
jgi:hypothetical protein